MEIVVQIRNYLLRKGSYLAVAGEYLSESGGQAGGPHERDTGRRADRALRGRLRAHGTSDLGPSAEETPGSARPYGAEGEQ